MTAEQVETIARKCHWVCASHLSPALMKDPNRDRYWEVMTEEFREPWREIVRLVAAEIEGTKPLLHPVLDYPDHPTVSGSHVEESTQLPTRYPDEPVP